MPDTLPTYNEWKPLSDTAGESMSLAEVAREKRGYNACRDLALSLLKNERDKRDEMIDYSRRLEAEIKRLEKDRRVLGVSRL